MFRLFLNNIDYEILAQGGMSFEKSFKSYRSLMTSFLTTSFILGLSLNCISLDDLAFSSK
jgi:hypothetical protein